MKVLLAASELSPLARTGGLGEAVAGLAKALSESDVDVTVAIPRYQDIEHLGKRNAAPEPAEALYQLDIDEFSILLIDDPPSFDRPGIYGPEPGASYDDGWVRFGRFSVVVRELAADYDVVHLHDSHTAPAALNSPVPTVLTVHNSAYPIYGPLDETAELLGAGPEDRAVDGPLEWFGNAYFLKIGLHQADAVTTVSPAFAMQLSTDPSISNGLDSVVNDRRYPVVGILNGIDTEAWNPQTDPTLPQTFSSSRLGGRMAARETLKATAGIEPGGFLLGAVTRVTEQKGIGLLDPYVDVLVGEGVQLIVVGNGDLDHLVDRWAERHPNAIWHSGYSEELARLVSAGVDAYLMPSRFEPCGLGQMYAMRYGAPPIVRLTGGLADTVIDLDERPNDATGFGFRHFSPEELLKTIRRAMRVFGKHRSDWQRMQHNGMKTDLSWDRAAAEYISIYESVIDRRNSPIDALVDNT